jgi:outer membrane receptor for monomeric catechols
VKQPQLRPLAAAIQRLFIASTKFRNPEKSTSPRTGRITLGGLAPLGAAFAGMALAHADALAQPTEPQQPPAQAAKPSAAEVTLPGVDVKSKPDAADGLRGSTTRVGKTLQDPHEIPQAITTITNSLMEQQQVGSLREALRNVSGLTFNAAEGGRSGDNMNRSTCCAVREPCCSGADRRAASSTW